MAEPCIVAMGGGGLASQTSTLRLPPPPRPTADDRTNANSTSKRRTFVTTIFLNTTLFLLFTLNCRLNPHFLFGDVHLPGHGQHVLDVAFHTCMPLGEVEQ